MIHFLKARWTVLSYRAKLFLVLLSLSCAAIVCAIAVPRLRTRLVSILSYAGEAGGDEFVANSAQPSVVPTSDAADGLSELTKLESSLEAKVERYEQELKGIEDATTVLRQQLKDAVAEVTKTNDLLVKEQAEWRKAISAGSSAGQPSPAEASDGKVNLNTASISELDGLTGIGPTYAQRIIDYRTKNGPFKSAQDLLKVEGIGPKLLEKIQDQIRV